MTRRSRNPDRRPGDGRQTARRVFMVTLMITFYALIGILVGWGCS